MAGNLWKMTAIKKCWKTDEGNERRDSCNRNISKTECKTNYRGNRRQIRRNRIELSLWIC